MIVRATLVMLAVAVSALPARAANADHPYQNVDKRNDSGNDTGDSRVEGLNRGQLDQNQQGAAPQTQTQTATPPSR